MLTAGPTVQSNKILLPLCKQFFVLVLFDIVGICLEDSLINVVHVFPHDCFEKRQGPKRARKGTVDGLCK
jgi:hypothetical protein